MIQALKTYFDQIKKLDATDATEHTLRPALQNLLVAFLDDSTDKITIIHEPKKDKDGKGAPDFKFKSHECILGYLENKKLSESLDKTLKSDQIKKYKTLSGNLIITNYLEWVWLVDGEINKRETFCYASDVGNLTARLDTDKAAKVGKLIAAFLSTPPRGIAKGKELAPALATRCHELREFLTEELIRQESEHQEGKLYGLFGIFKKDVFHQLDLAGFADAFAQMLGYGLFLARLNSGKSASVTLRNAKRFIPANFELIRELVDFLDELERSEYIQIKWLIEEILSIMNTLDLDKIHEDLAFTKRQGQLLDATEEERLIFAKDPYIYFYEDFLKHYDAKMRKSRGVYYTPPPVVNFIVRAIDGVLKQEFGITKGLADHKSVTVLDFATGTGTFLLEILHQILDSVSRGVRDQIIHEHALKNLYGFEYLIAPYTIAHLKLSQFLHDKGYRMQPKERLQIYLTNTLEPISPEPNFLLPALTKEVEYAQKIKDKPILVITGNPPYSGISQNNGVWISRLINTYKFVDGKPFGERRHWLNDDYVKFIRFAQWKMEQVDEGVVGIITNHSFLDNPTFRGMRQSLMETFSQIYVLDLHGNSKRKEVSPDGSKDENVFDIEQGVSISIFLRAKRLKRGIFHADFWGKRLAKYHNCLESDLSNISWTELTPNSPFYFFIPKDEGHRTEYEKGWPINAIFSKHVTGIVTARDALVTDTDKKSLERRIAEFRDLSKADRYIREKYALHDTRSWKLPKARETLASMDKYRKHFGELLHSPFDVRSIFYHPSMVDWGRDAFMKNILKDNVSLLTTRLTKDDWSALVTDVIPRHKSVSRFDIGYMFPLYLYEMPEDEKASPKLFHEERTENLNPKFRKFLDAKYGKYFDPETVMGYIYAVFYSPSYRRKYAEFHKADFPRVPFVNKRATFEALAVLGGELVQMHLLKSIPASPKVDYPKKGDNIIGKPLYDERTQRLYINKAQYFAPVPRGAWEFQVGGYHVLEGYLKARRDRELSLAENETLQSLIKVLHFTKEQMHKIDATWRP